MNTFKVKAVRMALINTELDIINDFIEKQDDNQFRFQLRIITDENFPTKSKSPIIYGNKK